MLVNENRTKPPGVENEKVILGAMYDWNPHEEVCKLIKLVKKTNKKGVELWDYS